MGVGLRKVTNEGDGYPKEEGEIAPGKITTRLTDCSYSMRIPRMIIEHHSGCAATIVQEDTGDRGIMLGGIFHAVIRDHITGDSRTGLM